MQSWIVDLLLARARQQLATMLTPEMFGEATDILRRRREVYPEISKNRTKGASSSPGHFGSARLLAEYRAGPGRRPRSLGWRGEQRCRSVAHPAHIQVTHATDSDTNAERDYIVAELLKNRTIAEVNSSRAGERVPVEKVNHYITDGEVTVATLAPVSR
jgi:hypothetical protein